jgi:hypothetical protein
MKKLFFIVIFGLMISLLQAQTLAPTVFASGGEDFKGTEYRLSSTIGELIVTTERSSGYILTQGFQQEANLYLSDIETDYFSTVNVEAYPNPTMDIVNVNIESAQSNGRIEVLVFNQMGQQVNPVLYVENNFNSYNFQIDLSNVARGNYFVRIIDLENQYNYADFKVVKL